MVSVPVLSEQMTDVQPSVSTEGRLRTMAFFLAIRCVPKTKWQQIGLFHGSFNDSSDNLVIYFYKELVLMS